MILDFFDIIGAIYIIIQEIIYGYEEDYEQIELKKKK